MIANTILIDHVFSKHVLLVRFSQLFTLFSLYTKTPLLFYVRYLYFGTVAIYYNFFERILKYAVFLHENIN